MRNTLLVTVAVTGLTLGTAGAVFAESPSENDALGITKTPISLTHAITSAEQHVGGKASRAEYEQEGGRPVFDVEVVKGKDVMDVKVDPTSGKVISAAADKIDQGEDEAHEVDD